MSDQKVYTINGRKWTLGKLSWRQRKLTVGFEQKLREKFVRMYELGRKPEKGKKNAEAESPIGGLFQVSVDLDTLLYSDDGALTVFLGTLLVPVGEMFDETKIAERAKEIETATEETIAEVLQDFFSRTRSFIGASMSVAPNSKDDAKPSSASSTAGV